MTSLEPNDVIWVLFCICLVIFMQAGFTCLEAGYLRSKNNINVVMKNSADLCLSITIFSLAGFNIMFFNNGHFVDWPSPITSSFSSHFYIIFLFHAMFCATTVTIISGAVAERMAFVGYLFLAAITSGIIYPVIGHWIWGELISEKYSTAWLAQLGFHDFAGATVVHSVGGWVALAAILVIGPRLGRFGKDAGHFHSSSLPISSLGVFLLWIGWLGFNGGSSMRIDSQTPLILVITIFGGVSGMLSAIIFSYIYLKKACVKLTMNGGLAGLVSVTGAADILGIWPAFTVGLVAGIFPLYGARLLEKLKIDDPIGVIPVHLLGGIWGTVVVGFCLPLQDSITRFDAISIQIFGIVVVGFSAFFTAYLILRVANHRKFFRVSSAAEMVGLNVWEHGASDSHLDLIRQMAAQAKSGRFESRISVEPQTDAYHIATFYNSVINKVFSLQQENNEALTKAMWLAEHDPLTGLANRRAMTQALGCEMNRINDENDNAIVAVIDIDNFKQINDLYGHERGDEAIQKVADILQKHVLPIDFVGRLGGDEFCILLSQKDAENGRHILEKIRKQTETMHLQNSSIDRQITISIGFSVMRCDDVISNVLKKADEALYESKRRGRNQTFPIA